MFPGLACMQVCKSVQEITCHCNVSCFRECSICGKGSLEGASMHVLHKDSRRSHGSEPRRGSQGHGSGLRFPRKHIHRRSKGRGSAGEAQAHAHTHTHNCHLYTFFMDNVIVKHSTPTAT
ncbi:hypothetical protein VNO78_32502 [Psophocarpus tetragonolobus]|uniref:Uncharacterized protein n=1 Tax=Psophocarpus tetragonolobus TaxID=3891 RepID=A0AAN9P0M5_PSOTE